MFIALPIDASDIIAHLERIEALATLTQQQLDALTAAIDTAVADIRQDIADIKAQIPDLDTTALEASVANLAALDAENPPPPATPV
jgi:hypothetical protein